MPEERSAASSSRRKPPEAFVFFIDRSLAERKCPKRCAPRAVEIRVHDELFPQGTEDVVWLREAGSNGWIVITRDDRIRYNHKEKLMKEAKAKSKNELLPGTLEMLILKTLSIESMHGYGIAQHIQMLSADVLTIEEGSLYPALQRMLVKRWVLAEWKISANNRRARFYTLTTAGKKQLGVEESRFSQMFGAIMRVMKTT